MKRFFLGLGAATAILALPAAANAYGAYVVTDLNLRACPSTQCVALTVIPGGAQVNVLASSGGWNYVTFAGVTGYAAANYIATAAYVQQPPVVVARPPVVVTRYPVYPVYPTYAYPRRFYARPGFSLSFRFSG
jgi:uncharacterized protein YraI